MTIVFLTEDLCDEISKAWTLKTGQRVKIDLRKGGGISIRVHGAEDPELEAGRLGVFLVQGLLSFFATECEDGDLLIIPGLTPA